MASGFLPIRHGSNRGLAFVDETKDTSHSFADTTCSQSERNSTSRHFDKPIESQLPGSPRGASLRALRETLPSSSSSPVIVDSAIYSRRTGSQVEIAHPLEEHVTDNTNVRLELDSRSGPSVPDIGYHATFALHSSPTLSLPRSSTRERRVLSLQETCLMRHFVENLANPFDCTDKDKHFTYVVPQRAMTCPVLFYAICTASAGHLVRRFSKQWPNRIPTFDDIPLTELTEETVVEYHNACISLFISMSNDPSCNYDENVFAAATILRFYEQLDVDLSGLDSEIYLGVVRAVVLSQPDYTFGSFDDDYPPPRTADVVDLPFTSLGYSACLVALRQEIWSVLINRRPFRLFRRTGKSYNPPEPTGDFEWSNHIMFWCADVLRFCFGDEGRPFPNPRFPQDRLGQWEYLDGFKRNWETVRPESFQPLYTRDAEPGKGRYFAQIVHMNDCQVLGLQHFEIACILLEAYHPDRPPIGPGATARNLAIDERVRQRTLKVCGLALSNRKSHATLITAAIVITMCGEIFTDTATQKVMLDVLSFVRREHAWPSQSVLLNLQNAWELRKKSH
ncbi:hypothetical protein BJY01DRAFT_244841 [Aspergillus pseudoustus]|uniref:Transcription factor domain-containing protein n=1 Tax=Aspergillus pseudoustus TaxID=1810923 RepID=A0ABR4KKW6_9EURO